MPTRNRFGMLREEGMAEEREEQGPEPDPPPTKKTRTRRKTRQNSPPEQTKDLGQPPADPEVKLLERPHKSTWFLPGRVGRVPVQILVDTVVQPT